MAPVTPEVLWAQRSNSVDEAKNVIFLTLNTPDVAKPEIKLTATSLSFKGASSNGKDYEIELEFFDEIDVDNSTHSHSGRGVYFVLRKKEAKEEYWPRLLKDKRKYHFLKTDFDRWVDEDEQQEAAADDDFGGMGGMGGMPGMPGMGGMGGMGGMPGMDGLDLSALSGMGGMGGAGGLDFSALQSEMGGMGMPPTGPSAMGLPDDSDDSDDEQPPELVADETPKA
ncbi:HSP20-like chaperone [Dipodascopsis tothii]|uniref:HSP20-like chaperone n=1 Tax=Dipodascopsis tothii TaxID=44089 RepID=UPI0034CDAAF3